jgi:hypothetical protein
MLVRTGTENGRKQNFKKSIMYEFGNNKIEADTNLHTVHKTTHRLLGTTATTPSAERHMQQLTNCTPEDGHIVARNL